MEQLFWWCKNICQLAAPGSTPTATTWTTWAGWRGTPRGTWWPPPPSGSRCCWRLDSSLLNLVKMARLNISSFRTLGLNVMSGSELNSIRSSNYSIQWVSECGHPRGRVCFWFWQLVIRIPSCGVSQKQFQIPQSIPSLPSGHSGSRGSYPQATFYSRP